MKTRIVHTKIWKDDFITKLDLVSKLIFIYLLTNESVNITGIYEIPDRFIIFDLGITKKQLEKAKELLKEKIIFKNGWVRILNIDKYNVYSGPKNEIARNRELEQAPLLLKENYTYPSDTSIDRGIDRGIDTPHNTNQNTNTNKKKEFKLIGNTMTEI